MIGWLFAVSRDNNLHYLSFRFWIGTWVSIFLLIIVMFDLSFLVRYITRFTEESFAVLISLIFIYEAFHKIFDIRFEAPVGIGHQKPIGCHCQMNVSFVNESLIYATPHPPVDDNGTVLPVPVYDFHNVTSHYHGDCLTREDLLIVSHHCVSVEECFGFGLALTGDSCDVTPVPDVFLLSLFLFFGTFTLAYTLRIFRTSTFFASVVS